MGAKAKKKLGIIGASGYGGAELARLLLNHDEFELVYGSASQEAGNELGAVHPNLFKRTDLILSSHPQSALDLPKDLDGLFLATPHGKSMDIMPYLPADLCVVDLAGDYRLKDIEVFQSAYKMTHKDFERQREFVYGLPEIYGEEIKNAKRVANPGCFAITTQLALYPLIKEDLLKPRIIVDAKTGSSGSGATAKAKTHHPFRAGAFYAYKTLDHQHLPEIYQTLAQFGYSGDLLFQTHSTPLVRGIFISCYGELRDGVGASELEACYKKAYAHAPFVRLVSGSPDVNWVRQTNYCDIGFGVSGQNVVLFAAIDNLVKGAAGTALQNMNLMLSVEETSGLGLIGGHPS